eukprot:gene1313-32666_t
MGCSVSIQAAPPNRATVPAQVVKDTQVDGEAQAAVGRAVRQVSSIQTAPTSGTVPTRVNDDMQADGEVQVDGEVQAAVGREMPQVSKGEAFVAANKKLCLGAAKFASKVISATGMPGANIVSGMMDKVVELVDTATDNYESCRRIVKKVWNCDKALGGYLSPAVLKLVQIEKQLAEFQDALKQACDFVQEYGHNSGAVGRTLRANSIKEELDQCCKALDDAIQSLTLATCIGLCSVVGFQALNACANKAAQSRALCDASYLQEWWKIAIGIGMHTVLSGMFMERLVKWYDRNENDLKLYPLSFYDENIMGEELDLPPLSELPDVPGMVGCKAKLPSPVFLKHVVVPLMMMDDNCDGKVSKQELKKRHLLAVESVKLQKLRRPPSQDDDDDDDPLQPPDSLPALLSAIYKVFDRSILTSLSSADVGIVVKALQEKGIIQSYGVSRMLQEYIEGSRVWLYQKLTDWLDTDIGTSRVFMLLADPGMGKSVFSSLVVNKLAVRSGSSAIGHKHPIVSAHHFFKVNEARSQAKAMILCLAHQLAERLPGMDAKLLPVVEQNGAGASFSTKELFHEYILQPLQQLAGEAEERGEDLPSIVLLLDALDEPEARGGANGEGARHQVADLFKKWNPMQLQPSAKENMEDVKLVVEHRMRSLGLVDDLNEQVRELQERSQGEFVWLKFAFDLLSKQTSSATSEEGTEGTHSLSAYEFDAYSLPRGQVGMYEKLLRCVRMSLLADDKAFLWDHLHGRVLPVLLVVREAPTLGELAWLSGVPESDVQEGLELLQLLFPMAQQQQGIAESQAKVGYTGRIFPFHKSVLDFLGSKEEASPDLYVDAETGLQLCAKVCRLRDDQKWGSDSEMSFDNDYVTKHAIYHLARAKDLGGLRERALDLRRWVLLANNKELPDAFMSNASDLLVYSKDLKFGSDDELYHVYRWLSRDCLELVKYPKNVVQSAMEVPASSELHRRAMHICKQVKSVLDIQLPRVFPSINTYDHWPHALQVIQVGSLVNSVAFSPDGKTLASASKGNKVHTWDVATGKHRLTMEGCRENGRTLASAASYDKSMCTWDVETAKNIITIEGHSFTSVAFSPDGRTLASASADRTVHTWDVETGKQMLTIEAHYLVVHSVAFSPDGRTLASAGGDRKVCTWDSETGKKMLTMEGHRHEVVSIAFSPDGKTIASASEDKTVRTWDVETGDNKITMEGHHQEVSSVAFSPDGRTLASTSHDKSVRTWDIGAGNQMLTMEGCTDVVDSVAFSPDGRTLATGEANGKVRTWDRETGKQMLTMEGHSCSVVSVAFSPDDGKTLATASDDTTVRTWDSETGKQMLSMDGHNERVKSVAFSPDGKTLATASDDKTVRTWDSETGKQMLSMAGHNESVNGVAFFPDGRTLATASDDNTVRVWNSGTGKQMLSMAGHNESVNSLAFSPDGKTLATASDDNTESGDMSDMSYMNVAAAFSPDGKTLAAAARGNTVCTWDVETGKKILTLKGHQKYVHAVAFSPDGKTLASSSEDKSVRTWDVEI